MVGGAEIREPDLGQVLVARPAEDRGASPASDVSLIPLQFPPGVTLHWTWRVRRDFDIFYRYVDIEFSKAQQLMAI
jgi:hypothetical protein